MLPLSFSFFPVRVSRRDTTDGTSRGQSWDPFVLVLVSLYRSALSSKGRGSPSTVNFPLDDTSSQSVRDKESRRGTRLLPPHVDAGHWMVIDLNIPYHILTSQHVNTFRSPEPLGAQNTTLKILYSLCSPLIARPTLEFTVSGAFAHNLFDYRSHWGLHRETPMRTDDHDGTQCNIYLVACG